MNHDATHCADYKKSVCPKDCDLARLTAELKKTRYYLPISWADYKHTKICPLKKDGDDRD